jgi:hypothetical protein
VSGHLAAGGSKPVSIPGAGHRQRLVAIGSHQRGEVNLAHRRCEKIKSARQYPFAVPRAIDIGGVEKDDAQIKGTVNGADGFVVVHFTPA